LNITGKEKLILKIEDWSKILRWELRRVS